MVFIQLTGDCRIFHKLFKPILISYFENKKGSVILSLQSNALFFRILSKCSNKLQRFNHFSKGKISQENAFIYAHIQWIFLRISFNTNFVIIKKWEIINIMFWWSHHCFYYLWKTLVYRDSWMQRNHKLSGR